MSEKHYAYIDALRGYAILLVIAVHTAGGASDFTGIWRRLVDQGARGVQLFFIVSALTLMMSWHSRQDGAINFYIRRFFRIAPMFWISIIGYLWLHGYAPGYWSPDGMNHLTVFMTAIFSHGWNPAYFNSVVPGGWSIAVEMFFYLLFPLLAYLIRNAKGAIIGCTISLFIAHLSFRYALEYRHFLWPNIQHDYLTWGLINLWFPNELPVFMVGIYLFFLISSSPSPKTKYFYKTLLVFSVLMMAYLALRNDPYSILRGYISIYEAYGFIFAIFAYALAKGAGGILVNSVAVMIGKVSYSAYLLHFAVMELFGGWISGVIRLMTDSPSRGGEYFLYYFPAIVVVTVSISSMTYVFIEKPMIKIGNRLIKFLDNRRTIFP